MKFVPYGTSEILRQMTTRDKHGFGTTTLEPISAPVWAYFRELLGTAFPENSQNLLRIFQKKNIIFSVPNFFNRRIVMDIKEIISDVVGKISGNKNLIKKFKKDPLGTVKSIIGTIDLPDGALNTIVDAVKAKINLKDAGSLLGKLKGLFGKK